jgi:hypothetical protein
MFIIYVICAITNNSKGQILPGQAPLATGDEMLLGARWRNLHPTSSLAGDEHYMGIPDLGIAANRSVANFSYSPVFNISFNYDAINNSITTVTTLATTTSTTTKTNISAAATAAGKTRPLSSMNVFQLRIRNRVPASTTTVSNITLNGVSVSGVFSNGGNNSNLYWYGYSNLYGTSFTLTAQVELNGNYSGNNENNVVEFLFGSSTLILPIQSVTQSITHYNGRNIIDATVVSTESLQKAILFASKDGIGFTAIDSIQQPGNSFTFYDPNFANQYYYIKLIGANGNVVLSKIKQVPPIKTNVPFKIVNISNGAILITTNSVRLNAVKLYNTSGQMTYLNTTINSNQHYLQQPEGIYMAYVVVNNKLYVVKLMVR